MKTGASLRLLLVTVLWILLGVYAISTARNFYRYVDHAIYLATDDSEASVAYSLATEGRYAFLSSPILADMDRTHGQFNYGPFFFYVAAGLIWLFGYSLTLVRSIHLWVILGTVAAAGWWFGGKARAAAAACFGLGILYSFEFGQWPIARPDSFVTACAIGCVVCLGLGVTRWRARYWFGAGLLAACGAFTHLIAWALLPASGLVLALAVAASWGERPLDAWRNAMRSALALVVGAGLGVAAFYASFGFRVSDQLKFISAYRQLRPSTDGYLTILLRHFDLAFGYLPTAIHRGVWGLLLVSWVWIGMSFRPAGTTRRLVHAYLVPPVALWTAYILSNGWYGNYHLGYAILHQALACWTLAALLWIALTSAQTRFPRAAGVATTLVVALLVAQSVRQLAWRRVPSEWMQRVSTWVSISEYVDRVLSPIPARGTAWGSLAFGIEVPSRIQLVQANEAMKLASRATAQERHALAPEFLVFGYWERHIDMLSALHGTGDSSRARIARALRGTSYRLVSLVAAAPYGTTRVYERAASQPAGARVAPVIDVYDAFEHRWRNRLGTPLTDAFHPVTPVALRIDAAVDSPPVTPARTMAADLPPGWYLVSASVTPDDDAPRARLLAATASTQTNQAAGELGAAGDFAAYTGGDRDVYLLLNHPGGTLLVSQFDDAPGASLDHVVATPAAGLLDDALEAANEVPLPAISTWTAMPGVAVHPEPPGRARVDGDDSSFGYQLVSPVVPAAANDKVTVRLKGVVGQGQVCSGVLDASNSTWLVAADAFREELRFSAGDSGGFRVVFANCNLSARRTPSRFSVEPGHYVDVVAKLYVDRLTDAAGGVPRSLEAAPALDLDDAPLDPDVRLVPGTLRIGRRDLARADAGVRPEDLSYKAAIVDHANGSWTMKGRADGRFSYLIRSKDRPFSDGDVLVVTGRVERGGMTIGLFKKETWARQLNIETPGPFTVVMAPPSSGSYSVTIANDLGADLETAITISRMGLLPAARR